MPPIGTGPTSWASYTFPSAIAARSTQVLTMPNATSVVFVVDDDISVRESLELLVRSEGWRCETFASAQEFLSPDLVQRFRAALSWTRHAPARGRVSP